MEYEVAQYFGNFRNGKREGQGKMVWGDGSCFEGLWKNDLRYSGTMVMGQSGWVYKGRFKNDRCHDKDGVLLSPTMIIYQGHFARNKTCPIGLLLYSNGSIYYGQHQQFVRNGVGKNIDFNGSIHEGSWENDKLSGPSCRIYDNNTNECYTGSVSDGKKMGSGILYDPDRDEVYDGNFEMNKRSGEGMIYKRNGHVLKGEFRNNYMEGQFENIMKISQSQVAKIFKRAMNRNATYISVNEQREIKVLQMLKKARPETQQMKEYGGSSPNTRTKNLFEM